MLINHLSRKTAVMCFSNRCLGEKIPPLPNAARVSLRKLLSAPLFAV